MYVNHEVVCDLLNPRKNVIDVTQDDSTRKLTLILKENQTAYNIAADLDGESWIGAVEFKKADGHSGLYDTEIIGFEAVEPVGTENPKQEGWFVIVDGKYIPTEDTTVQQGTDYYEPEDVPAVSLVSGKTNIFNVYLDGQCFTAPGETLLNVRFFTETGKLLHTFGIIANVHKTASSDVVSTDFTRLMSIADLRLAVSDLEQRTDALESDVVELSEEISELGTAVLSVNQQTPDDHGDVSVDRVCFINDDVPINSGPVSQAALTGTVTPTDRHIGDIIIGKNGYVGRIVAIASNSVTVHGYGTNVGDATDRTWQWQNDSQQRTPEAFLLSLQTPGKFYITDTAAFYYCEIQQVSTTLHHRITAYTTTAKTEKVYIGGTLQSNDSFTNGKKIASGSVELDDAAAKNLHIKPASGNGVVMEGYYQSSVPILHLAGFESDEEVVLGGIANPAGQTDAVPFGFAESRYVRIQDVTEDFEDSGEADVTDFFLTLDRSGEYVVFADSMTWRCTVVENEQQLYHVVSSFSDDGFLDVYQYCNGNLGLSYGSYSAGAYIEIPSPPTSQHQVPNKEYVDGYRVAVSGTSPTIAAADNTIYTCGQVSSLTISSIPVNGAFSVIFTSGSTATVLTIPNTLKMPTGFSVEANKRYEINVVDGYGLAASWGVS